MTTQVHVPEQLEEMFNFVLDDDAKDQIGTLLVALLVGFMATAARVAVKRKDRWWFNMIIVHSVIFVYWWNRCHLDEPETPWLKTIHGGLCWRTGNGQFQRILFWAGDRERWWLNVLVWLAVLGNVVPAYATGNEASRHMGHIKKRACNPMINHIIAGILCVCFPYFVVTWKAAILVPVAVAFDIYHQITIHRLIANHDGIWALRAVSMSLAITKWIVVLNMYTADPWDMLDQLFVLSTGFLGTRAYGAIALVCYWMGLGDIKTAEWYSIGLMTADIMIMGRLWGQMRIAFWLTIVNCAAMHYHQMWKKWLHLRPHFVGMTVVLTVIVCHSGTAASLLFTIVWCFGNFVLPHFNRFRPVPVTEFTPTVTPAYRLIREISGRISTRLGQLSTRSSRLFTTPRQSLRAMSTRSNRIQRISSLRGFPGLGSTHKSLLAMASTRSLCTPSNRISENEEFQATIQQREAWSVDSDEETDYEIPNGDSSEPEAPQWQYGQKRTARKEPAKDKQFDELKAMILALQKQIQKQKSQLDLVEKERSERSICESESPDPPAQDALRRAVTFEDFTSSPPEWAFTLGNRSRKPSPVSSLDKLTEATSPRAA